MVFRRLAIRSRARRSRIHRSWTRCSMRRPRLERLESRHLLSGLWHNTFNALDVNDDGFVSPSDVLAGVNDLNRHGARVLEDPPAGERPPAYLDVNNDGSASPADVLILVNQLNLGDPFSLVALGEGDKFVRQGTRLIELGQERGTRTLSFELAAQFGENGAEPSVVEDAVLIYLVDPAAPAHTLLDRGTAGTPLVTLTASGVDYVEGLVDYQDGHVEIDLSSLGELSQGQLLVQLLNHDGQPGSKALLRSLRNTVDEDATPGEWTPAEEPSMEPAGPLNTDWLMANGNLDILVDNARFDVGSGRYAADVRVVNRGERVGREVMVELVGLPPEVRPVNASGAPAAPYLNLSRAISAEGLETGQESMPVTLLLDNPQMVPFQWTPRVLAPDPVTTTRVSGTVRDAAGQPVAGVPVELAGYSATTAADGSFQLEMPSDHVPTKSMYVQVPTGDPMFDPQATGDAWIPLNRAQFDPATGNSIDNPRRHPNLITPFVDASMVYGSDEERAAALRTGDGTGKLKIDEAGLLPRNNEQFFPDGPLENDNAGRLPSSEMFVAGDVRASENPGLTALHTLFVREHNRRAEELAASHPDMTGDEIYHRARHWVGALIQHITYQEFLPMLLGPDALPAYSGYDPSADPRIGGLFSTAVYRLGHSLITEDLWRLDEQGQSLPGGPLPLRDGFFQPAAIQGDGIEPYLRGMAQQPAERLDAQVVDSLRNFLFGPPGSGGLDLASLNIQRGRDMGLPSYNELRRQLGLPAAEDFADVTPDPDTQARLASVYDDVEQIDLWVGGLSEPRVAGAMVGETFHAVLRRQFLDLRDGDRFWYENGQFPAAELDAIRDTRLADVIRRNSSIDALPAFVFSRGTPPAGPAAGGQPASGPVDEFRTLDGSFNHLDQPWLGQAGDRLKMDYEPAFADGMGMPAGEDRPSGRMVSNAVIAQSESLADPSGATSMLTIWGQFVDHDISLTPGGKDDHLTIRGDLLDPSRERLVVSLDTLLGGPALARADNVIEQPIVLP